MRREKREGEKREIKGETGGEREERALTCIRGSPRVNLKILPIQRFESRSRTTPARILQSFALHEACHAQPLSRSRQINFCKKHKYIRTHFFFKKKKTNIHARACRSMMCGFSYLFQALLQISSPHSSDRQKRKCQ